MYHVDTMLSVIEKYTTSFKSGISIKSFHFAYFFIKNHNVKTTFHERIVEVPAVLDSEAPLR